MSEFFIRCCLCAESTVPPARHVCVLCACLPCRDRLVPAEVCGLLGRVVVQIAGGWRHTMALDSEGGVWAWGWNKFGQLGESGRQPEGGGRGWVG